MTAYARLAGKLLLAVLALVALGLGIIWPWPAPDVDWRTPLGQALARKDCERAAVILNAATKAGVLDAYMLIKRETLGACYDTETLRFVTPGYPAFLKSEREDHAARGYRPPPGVEALDFWLRNYVRATYVLCREPYVLEVQADNVALSATLPEQSTWLLVLHRHRRDICVGIVENLAVALAERDAPEAKDLAYELAMYGPLTDSLTAQLVTATLLLQQQFVPRAARHDSNLVAILRSNQWTSLRQAAEINDPRAIELMITLLHKGPIVDGVDSLFGSHGSAYYWVLRSRRLGLPQPPNHAEIENALDETQRAKIKDDEEYDITHPGRLPSQS